jgi:hypothetical protein
VRTVPSPWKARLSLGGGAIGRQLTVTALDGRGKKLADASTRIKRVAKTKQGVDRGPRAGTT